MNETRCGLIGESLKHSYSGIIHSMLGYEYELISLPPEELEGFITKREFKGLNVTIPYKKAVMPFCDEISDKALSIGSVNTLVRDDDGKLRGYNTDYEGFLYLAERTGISFKGKKVLVLGGGGASLTVCAAARDCGAREITVVSRNGKVNYENIYEQRDAEILVNTTPVGMYPNNGGSLVDISRLPGLCGVLDLIYNPLRTRLVLDAREMGLPSSGGLPMLVAQATAASGLFFNKAMPSDINEEIHQRLLKTVQSIVLIGMPGCGKTSVGKLLSEKLGLELVDTDELIVKKAGKSIPEIFESEGEAGFRRLESEVIADCGKQGGRIIATGGGAVLNPDNYYSLAQNGRIYYLERVLERLATDGRPLSKGLEALAEIFEKRQGLYMKYSDRVIGCNGSIEAAAESIAED